MKTDSGFCTISWIALGSKAHTLQSETRKQIIYQWPHPSGSLKEAPNKGAPAWKSRTPRPSLERGGEEKKKEEKNGRTASEAAAAAAAAAASSSST